MPYTKGVTGKGIFEIIRDVSRAQGERTYFYDGTNEYADTFFAWANYENEPITMSTITIGAGFATGIGQEGSGTPITGKIYEFSIEYD